MSELNEISLRFRSGSRSKKDPERVFRGALEVGRRGGAALFTYNFEQGTLLAASPQGEKTLRLGLLSLTVLVAHLATEGEYQLSGK